MIRTRLLIWIVLLAVLPSLAQTTPKNYFWVQFKDKNGTPYQISAPEAFLSQRAIDRRFRQNIPIDETDLPVSPDYLDSLKEKGFEIVHTSKWLNGATVRVADSAEIRGAADLPFVEMVQLTRPANILKSATDKFISEQATSFDPVNYGQAIGQLTQLKGDYLHNKGFRGKGVQIAILDGGFWRVNDLPAFDSLRNENRILGTRDLVDPQSDFYAQNYHGMSVLSCMAGNMPGLFIGTAPDASFFLIRTEDGASEYLVEEDNWVAGAELADSLGADIINSSLGYATFGDPNTSHTYSDLNGNKTRITRAANMAFRKGILVFNSAGNQGDETWKYITAPADGDCVIAVGAVDKTGVRSYFSSFGPAFGGAVKPNLAALGSQAILVNNKGQLGFGSGTSFSSPILTGVAACLMQANPTATAAELKAAMEQSASQYNQPDFLLGFGIPDFEKADNLLKSKTTAKTKEVNSWKVAPNPFSDHLIIWNSQVLESGEITVSVFNSQGLLLKRITQRASGPIQLDDLSALPSGLLFLRIESGNTQKTMKLVKVGAN